MIIVLSIVIIRAKLGFCLSIQMQTMIFRNLKLNTEEQQNKRLNYMRLRRKKTRLN